MNLIEKLPFIFLSCLLLACSYALPLDERAIIFKKFPVSVKSREEKFFKLPSRGFIQMLLYKDSILFIRRANPSPYHFAALNLKTKAFIPGVVPYGRKAGQVLPFMSSGIIGDYLWMHDLTRQAIVFFNVNDIINNFPASTIEHPIPFGYYWLQPLTTDSIIESGDYDSDYKLTIEDVNTKKIESQVGKYPPELKFTNVEKSDYESFLYLRPMQDKCAFAARYADRLEIFDLKTNTSKATKGPGAYEPDLGKMKGSDGKMIAIRNENTRFSFVRGMVTNKFIYLLYSGNMSTSAFRDQGNEIYVYDWDGNPIKKITLKEYVSAFAVTSDDSVVYTCDSDNGSINVFKL